MRSCPKQTPMQVCHFFATTGCKHPHGCTKGSHDHRLVLPHLDSIVCKFVALQGKCTDKHCAKQHFPAIVERYKAELAKQQQKHTQPQRETFALARPPLSTPATAGALVPHCADSASRLTATVLQSLRAGPGTCTHEEVFVRHDRRLKVSGGGHASMSAQQFAKQPNRPKQPKQPTTADIVFSFDTTGSMAPYIQKVLMALILNII